MRWLPIEVPTPPTAEFNAEEIRRFSGLKSDSVAFEDRFLLEVGRGVVADVEFYCRRAIFEQRRRFTAVGSVTDRPRQRFRLEPRAAAPAPTVTLNNTALASTNHPEGVMLAEAWEPEEDDRLVIEFDAGYAASGAVPEGLRYGILAQIQHRLERLSVQSGGTPTGWLPGGQGMKLADPGNLLRWRAYNEPLATEFVQGGPRC